MHGTFLIRDYAPVDWGAIADIHDRARLDELWLTVGVHAFRPLAETPHAGWLFESRLHVAVLDGTIRGFTAIFADEIVCLYTDPERYRRGIARCLLRHAIDGCEGELYVSVLVGNDPALELFRSEGFEIIGTREGGIRNTAGPPTSEHVLRRGMR